MDAEATRTGRPVVDAVEEILGQRIPVLDHGFIRVVDYMGDDAAIVQAARVSYGKGTKRPSEDRALVRYLMRHWHSTPFEMCEIKLHVKLPIFVARQWIRHRTASVNEYSARYSILDREFYVPEAGQLATQSTDNRQGRGGALEPREAEEIMRLMRDDADRSFGTYERLLNEPGTEAYDPARTGLSRELARIGLSLSTYTQWYWKTDLHNLLQFLRLRADPHAQHEIRVYALEILRLVERWTPLAYEAFNDYRLEALTLSGPEVEMVRAALLASPPRRGDQRLSSREWADFTRRFDLPEPAKD